MTENIITDTQIKYLTNKMFDILVSPGESVVFSPENYATVLSHLGSLFGTIAMAMAEYQVDIPEDKEDVINTTRDIIIHIGSAAGHCVTHWKDSSTIGNCQCPSLYWK